MPVKPGGIYINCRQISISGGNLLMKGIANKKIRIYCILKFIGENGF